MKNIFLIPTDKPSNLAYRIGNISQEECLFRRIDYSFVNGSGTRNQNIYITSDEEIKEGDWYLFLLTNTIHKFKKLDCSQNHIKGSKKIILTTDQDLIKDGVQAIDDEFLEFIVKNPSCEEVDFWKYMSGEYSTMTKEEPKQETLEEASKRIYPEDEQWTDRHIFSLGAKWQQEQDKNKYSEEEVKQIIELTLIEYSDFVLADIPHWFIQFKKK
jgi:hypothetical protein